MAEEELLTVPFLVAAHAQTRHDLCHFAGPRALLYELEVVCCRFVWPENDQVLVEWPELEDVVVAQAVIFEACAEASRRVPPL